MNLSGERFFNTISEIDRNTTGGFQVPNYKVYDRNYSWTWDIGGGFNPPGDLIIYDLEAESIFQTVSFTADYLTYFRTSSIYFDEDLTFVTTLRDLNDIVSTVSGTVYAIHYLKVELDPDDNFSATITDLGTASESSSNGTTIILDYNKTDEILYVLTMGASGNFGNGGRGSRFLKYDIVAASNSFYGQDWRGATPSLVGGALRFRKQRIDFYGDEEVIIVSRDQERLNPNFGTFSLFKYSFKTDTIDYVPDQYVQEEPPNNNIQRNSLFYLDKEGVLAIPYSQWNNQDDNINIRYYSINDFSLLDEVNSFDSIFFSFVGIINYNSVTNTYETIGGSGFSSNRYVYELGYFQRDKDKLLLEDNKPLLKTPDFEILATASTVSVFGTAGIINGNNIDTMGVDENNNVIYTLVNGQLAGVSAKIVKTDLDFNLIDTFDIDDNTPYNVIDSREVKGLFDVENLTFYTILLEPSVTGTRALVRIEVDSMTLSSTTVSTIDNINGLQLGNGTQNFMLGLKDDILYWNHGYSQIQVGKDLYFRSHNVSTDTEISAVFLGTYSQIRNFYFDQDDLTVYYSLESDKKRYKYDYNTLTSSVINPYPYVGLPNVRHLGTASVPNPNKLVGLAGQAETFKEVTVNYISNSYVSNIDPEFPEGVNIEYISNDILYGYNSSGELYKIRRK